MSKKRTRRVKKKNTGLGTRQGTRRGTRRGTKRLKKIVKFKPDEIKYFNKNDTVDSLMSTFKKRLK